MVSVGEGLAEGDGLDARRDGASEQAALGPRPRPHLQPVARTRNRGGMGSRQ